MKYAIIAAGEGSRLRGEGIAVPKPLVTLCGEPMIDRLCRIFADLGAERIAVVSNGATAEHLRERKEVTLVEATTPSSMHSFHRLVPLLGEGRFCLTTTDTVFRPEEFAALITAFEGSEADGLMAVTDYVDDEKPLYVGTDDDLNITGFHDIKGACHYVSGGIYCLTHKAFPTLERCIASGQSRMRNFQRALVADGLRLKAYPFTKILDVDHAEDIAKAQAFLCQ